MLSQTVVGFDVGHSKTMSSGGKIPFDIVKINVGGGWSNTNHTFTAPETGFYFFSLSIMTEWTANRADAEIKQGDVQLRYVYGAYQASSTCSARLAATGSTVIKLNEGQEVHAERRDGTLFSNSNLHTHFVGFLIGKTK